MCKTIVKQNNLIECSFKELQNWKEIHHDLLNEIISLFQNDFLKKESNVNLFNFNGNRDKTLYVRRDTIEKNINIRRKSNEDLFFILKEIRDTSFTLKNFIDASGQKIKFKTLSFLNSVTLYENPGKGSHFKIEYSDDFAMLCHKGYSLNFGNYTTINLSNLVLLKSKYSKALYELFTSRLYKANSFEISEKELKEVLRFDMDAPFSYLTRQITRSEKDLKPYFEFKYNINKASKSIYFIIEEKEKHSLED